MSKIVLLPGAHVAIGHPDVGIVAALKHLLNLAETGQIIGLAACWVEGQNDICWQIEQGTARDALLVAAASGLHHDLQERWRRNFRG